MNGPPMASNQEGVAGYIARQMEIITANVCRDLELRLKRQEVGLPKGESMKEGINLTVQNAANINLGSQVGTINAALSVISQQGQSEVAVAIRELSEAVMRSSAIKDDQKQEALQVIADIAKQAEAKPECRFSHDNRLGRRCDYAVGQIRSGHPRFLRNLTAARSPAASCELRFLGDGET